MNSLYQKSGPEPKQRRSSWIIILSIVLLGSVFIVLVALTYLRGLGRSRFVPFSMQSLLTADYGDDEIRPGLEFAGMPIIGESILDEGGGDVAKRIDDLNKALQTPVPLVTSQPGVTNVTPTVENQSIPVVNTPTPTFNIENPTESVGGFTTTVTPGISQTPTENSSTMPTELTEQPNVNLTPNPQLPGTVFLVSPEGQINQAAVTFVWKPTDRAENYHFSIYGPEGVLHSEIISQDDLGCGDRISLCIYVPTLSWQNGVTYIFHVMASNNAGYGPLSDEMLFSLGTASIEPPGEVTLVSPEDAAVIDDQTPTLQWIPSSGSQWYRVYIRTLEMDVFDHWIASGDACSSDLCSMVVDVSLEPGVYGWTVAPYNPGGYGPLTHPFRLDIE